MPRVEDSSCPRRHRYRVGAIRLAARLVAGLGVSYRAAAATLALLPGAAGRAPHPATLRQWLLRPGLARLRRPLPAAPGGWVLIADHTAQAGPRKLFAVLGLPAAALAHAGFAPAHADVVTLAVEAARRCTGEGVYGTLRAVAARVGEVAQVVCDKGSESGYAVRQRQGSRPEVVSTYDVRHLLACLLKALLAGCPRWGEFTGHCGRSIPALRQTAGNFLAPPALRVEARYMNLDTHVRWAERLLAWEHKGDWAALAGALGVAGPQEAKGWFDQRPGWVREFGADVRGWGGMMAAARLALEQVHGNGPSRQTAGRFWLKWQRSGQGLPFVAWRLARRVRHALAQEGRKVPAGRALLGSSDVIESVFGKYEELVKAGPGELGAGVLLLPLLTGELGHAEIKQGLEAISAAAARQGVKEQMGETAQAKRCRILGGGPRPPDPPTDSQGPRAA